MSDESFKLADWPVKVRIPRSPKPSMFPPSDWYSKIWPDYSDWCNQTYGHGNWEYYYGEFLFKNEQDATIFRLRWQ